MARLEARVANVSSRITGLRDCRRPGPVLRWRAVLRRIASPCVRARIPTASESPVVSQTDFVRRRTFDKSFFVFLVIAVVSGLAVWVFKGSSVFYDTLDGDARLILRIVPLIGAGFLIGGFSQILIPSDLVGRWLGAESGMRGIAIATIAGIFTPGGPIISFPLVVALASAGADIGALVAYITSWSVLGLSRVIMWELPFMGVDFAATRWASSLVLPFIAGVLARRLQIRISAAQAANDKNAAD